MNPIVLGVALIFGLACRGVGLPPLIGFLVAGFALNAAGYELTAGLQAVADMGITLLLFSIGLKLKLGSLLRPQVWAVASIHMLSIIVGFGAFIYLVALTGLSALAGIDLPAALLLAFALSFSSTVFAVKILEDKGEAASLHGGIAIGILIMQDLFAVIFLAFSTGKVPTPLGVGIVVALIALKRVLIAVMMRCGHGELLVLFGVIVAIGGAEAFEGVGIKGDLGALFLGVLLSSGERASELSRTLLGFKDLFLIGFFLTIGLSGSPTPEMLGIALALTLLLPLKVGLFFALLTRFRLRARSSLLGSFNLANYSEFGLIVGSVAVSSGWIDNEWQLILAMAMSISFIIASPLNAGANRIFDRYEHALSRHEHSIHLSEEAPVTTGDAVAVVFGLGRIGYGAYETLHERYPDRVVGVDSCPDEVERSREAGMHVLHGDATDASFWRRVREDRRVRLVLLTMQNHEANLHAAKEVAKINNDGMLIGAASRHPEEATELRDAGVHEIFDFVGDAGGSFAEHMLARAAEMNIRP
jgi:glutathione-regulated potassium-efflux system ancillary protein KefC